MSTSEGRASKKAKIVDNESLDGASSDGVESVGSGLSDGLRGAEPILPSVMVRVNNEYCSGTSMNAHVSTFESRTYIRVDFFVFFLALPLYDVDYTKICISLKIATYREHSRFIYI